MVKLICYNIEYCEGLVGRWFDYLRFWKAMFPPKGLDKKIVAKLKKLKPDILALVEVDTGSMRTHKKDEVVYFEKKLGMKSFVEAVKYPFQSWLKLFHYMPIFNKQANAIVSKYKISNVKYHVLHEGTKRVVIEATMNIPKKVTVLLAHLALGSKAREKQIKELTNIVKKITNPVILMGDFNTFHGEKEIKKLLKQTHLHHCISMDDVSRQLTEPAIHPTRRLDYVLTSKEIKVKNYKALPFQFSDHLPLFVEFDMS